MGKEKMTSANGNQITASSHFLTMEGGKGTQLLRQHATAVICHLHYPDLLDELVVALEPLDGEFDLYLSIPNAESKIIPGIFTRFPGALILPMENVGRDINPFLILLKAILPLGYENLLKVHTKRSPHRADGDAWRQDMYARLLGNRENVLKIQERLAKDPQVGIIAPKGHVVSYRAYCGASRDRVLEIAKAAGISYAEEHDFPFVAGTMFWAKPQALAALTHIPGEQLEYEDEMIAPDGALVHALERFIGLAVHKAGMEILETDGQGEISKPDLTQSYPYTPPSKQLKLADIHKVVFFSAYEERFAIEHLRVTGPYHQAGIEVIQGMVNGEARIDLIPGVDAVVIQREFPRNLPVYEQIHQVANEHFIPIIYDLDDLLFNLPGSHPERQAMDYTSALMPMLSALMQANLVTVSTGKLRETLLDFNDNIQVLPNYLDDNLWKVDFPHKTDPNNERVIIGYMGSVSHTPDLEMITPVLVDLLAKYGDKLRFYIWETLLPEELGNNPLVIHTPSPTNNYREFAQYFQQQEVDIFIAPLDDNLFNRCKSGLKFLEYSALGVPGVYSNLDSYAELITNGQDGFLADSPGEWKEHLVNLIEDPILREQIGMKAQQTVKTKWLLSNNIASWQDILRVEEPGFNHMRQAKMASGILINSITGQLYWMQKAKENLLRDLEHQNSVLAGELETGNAQLVQGRSALETMRVILAGEQENLLNVRAALAQEQKALQSVHATLAQEQNNSQVMRTALAKLEADYQAKEKELAQAKEKASEQQTRLSALHVQLDVATLSMHLLEEERAQLEITVCGLKRQLLDKENENQSLALLVDEKLHQSQGLVDELSARTSELEAIKASRSWRVAQFLKKVRSKVAPVDGKLTRMAKKMSQSLIKPISKAWQKIRLRRDLAIIRRSPLFDRDWYLATYPDVLKMGVDPAKHYMYFGAFEGRDPSPKFLSSQYLDNNDDIKKSGMNPLVHFLKFGEREGRSPLGFHKDDSKTNQPADTKLTFRLEQTDKGNAYYNVYKKLIEVSTKNQSEDFIPMKVNSQIDFDHGVKPIAFYLPQFHPFPENDEWWGKGFTEWTNVSKAVPQFQGHYQPHLPGELGFYDLRLYDVQERQIELARNFGIYGFCFHYYWFSGRRLLEKPINIFLQHTENKFPFCVCWANENWTRRWDGKDDDILIAQEHSLNNDMKFIADLEPILRDERYIRINGRPVLIIYRPGLIKKPIETAEYWREYCESKGLGNPLIIGAQTFGFEDPKAIGFDAAIEFPPHNIVYTNVKHKVKMLNEENKGSIYDYREMVEKNIVPLDNKYRVYRTVSPAWDNEARKPGRGFSFVNSTPKLYRQWLDQVSFEEMAKHPHEDNIVFINAWNEWGESAYLEPDRKFGYAYLQATYEAIVNALKKRFLLKTGNFSVSPKKTCDTAVILHVYYEDLFDEIASYLDNIVSGFDLYISLPKTKMEFSETIFKRFPNAQLFLTDNKGRDIAPFIEIFRCISNLGYKAILKLHTKKSIHREDGPAWRSDMLVKLIGSEAAVQTVQDVLINDQEVGLIGPKGHVLDHQVFWGFNKTHTLKLAEEVGILDVEDPAFMFIAGSMFWAKPDALNLLNILSVDSLDFEPEPTPPDGAMAHAVERFIGLAAKAKGYSIKEIDEKGQLCDPKEGSLYPFAVPYPQ